MGKSPDPGAGGDGSSQRKTPRLSASGLSLGAGSSSAGRSGIQEEKPPKKRRFGFLDASALSRHVHSVKEAIDLTDHRPRRATSFWSSLAFRIAALNLIGLLIFMTGLILSNQFRRSSVDERLLALKTHSQFVAGALEQTAVAPRLGRSEDEPYDAIDRVAAVEILRRLVAPTEYRARIYDFDGTLIYDSWLLDDEGQVAARRIADQDENRRFFTIIDEFFLWLMGPTLSPPHTDPTRPLPEVNAALNGDGIAGPLQSVRLSDEGHLVVSVASPVKNVQAYIGAILMSTQGNDFDTVLWQDRRAIFQVFLIALTVNMLIAFLYANTVARPIRRLAKASDRIRFARGRSSELARASFPDLSHRADEIGTLAESFKEMTDALGSRIVAIEQFAADVSHEIKTPLTSLRSAMETLDIAPNEAARQRLIEVMKHDVDRLDRLITDISNASRLDAELSREDAEPVNIAKLLREITQIYKVSGRNQNVGIRTQVLASARGDAALTVNGIESRLGQVVQNLIENAVSFSPEGGDVLITTRLERTGTVPYVQITVEDEGPGIPEESLEKIFDRFYTSRPEAADFGKNSGLGLSISKQIVEAHRGQIWAENRYGEDGAVAGARFVVHLPALSMK